MSPSFRCYLQNINSLISVSEDCLIKVWSMEDISNKNDDITLYLNLRGHIGPIFSVKNGKLFNKWYKYFKKKEKRFHYLFKT